MAVPNIPPVSPTPQTVVPPLTPSPVPPLVPSPPVPPAPPQVPISNSSPIYQSGPNWKLIIIAALVALVLLLAGLGYLFKDQLPFGQSNQPVTLSYWGLWEPESVIDPLIQQYQQAHPNVTIKYEQRTLSQYRETLLAREAEGTGPDIFRFHNTWVPEIKDDLTAVPSSAYSKSDFESTFLPVAAQDLGSGGSYYGIPLEYDGLALVYNTDLFKAAGLTSAPTTWSDLRQAYAPKLTQYNADGSIKVGGVALGTAGNVENFSDIVGLLMLQNGVKMTSGGQIGFATTTSSDGHNLGVDALDFYTLFAKKTFTDKGPAWNNTMPNSLQAFASAKVAMIIIPSYKIVELQQLIAKSGTSINFKVAPVPQTLPPGQGTPINWATYWAEGVSKHSPHQQQAWDFLKFLSSKDALTQLYTNEAKLRAFGEIPSRNDSIDALKDDAYVGPYVSGARNAQSWYLASDTGDNGIDDQMVKYFGDAVNTVLSGTTSADSLKTAATGASQILSRYGLVQPSAAGAANQ